MKKAITLLLLLFSLNVILFSCTAQEIDTEAPTATNKKDLNPPSEPDGD